MKVLYYFKQMDSSPALETYTAHKLGHLRNLIDEGFPIKVNFEVGKDQNRVVMKCMSRDKVHTEVKSDTDEIHKSVDSAVQRLFRILTNHKEKSRRTKRTRSATQLLNERSIEEDRSKGFQESSIDAELITKTA